MKNTATFTDFDRMMASFTRLIWVIVAFAIVIATLTFYIFNAQPRVYEAYTRLLLAEPVNIGSTLDVPQVRPLAAAAYREAAFSTAVLEQMNQQFPGKLPNDSEKVREIMRIRSIETVGSSSIVFVLSVRNNNPREAAQMADAWAKALQDWEIALIRESYKRAANSLKNRLDWVVSQLTQPSSQTDLTGLRQLRASLERDLGVARSLENSATGQLSLLSQAEIPTKAVQPRPLLSAGIAAIATMLFGFIVLAVRDRLSSS